MDADIFLFDEEPILDEELISNEKQHVSATQSLGIIPATQENIEMNMIIDEALPCGTTVQPVSKMTQPTTVKALLAATAPSFKDKLLHATTSSTEEDDEIQLGKEDVTLGLNKGIPTINFSKKVLEVLNKKMGFAIVVKLLSRTVGYRALRTQLQNIWRPSGQFQVTDLNEGCFIVKFKEELDFQKVFLSGL